MIPESVEDNLKYPLYKLYYIEDAHSFEGMLESEVKNFYNEYEIGLCKNIIDSLVWVSVNPNAQLEGILPGIKFPNDEIHLILNKILASIQSYG